MIVTKKGKLISKTSSAIFQSNSENFGETLDKESQTMAQIPVVFVFPAEDSSQKYFNPKISSFSKITQSEFDWILADPQNGEKSGSFFKELDKNQSDLIDKTLQKLSNKTVTSADLQNPFSAQILDVDKIAGMLQIAPEIFEIENDFHEFLLALQNIIQSWEFAVCNRKNALFLSQNQIFGNEIIFVSLVNSYKSNKKCLEK